jgi:hypothetical protein
VWHATVPSGDDEWIEHRIARSVRAAVARGGIVKRTHPGIDRRIEKIAKQTYPETAETVFKAGIGYDSKKLIDSVRGQVGIR